MWRETIQGKTVAEIAKISIHSLRVEGDRGVNFARNRPKIFQSTPSVWRETLTAPPVLRRGCYFNPLPPCGGRRTQSAECQTLGIFQSTPSVWRETPHNNAIYMRSWAGFQSTPSVWRETLPTIALCPILSISIHSLRVEGDQTHGSYYQRPCAISIHSLRVEGDLIADQKIATSRDFNPLPPCGGRRLRR